jgi:hypothetical protein
MQRPLYERYMRGASNSNIQSYATEDEEVRHIYDGAARLGPSYLPHQHRLLGQGLAHNRGGLQQSPSLATAMMPPIHPAAMVGTPTRLPVMQGPSYTLGRQSAHGPQAHGYLPSPSAMQQVPYGHMDQLVAGPHSPALAPYSSSQLTAQLQSVLGSVQLASLQDPSAVDVQRHPGSTPTMQHDLTESPHLQSLLPRRPCVSGWFTGRAQQSGSHLQAITNLRMCASA